MSLISRPWRLWLAAAALAALAGCGFHLRATQELPFASIYTNIDANSDFGSNLRRVMLAHSPGLSFVEDALAADVYLHQLDEQQNLRQVSLDADGRVEEYELNLVFSFELLDRSGHVLLAPTTLRSSRELPYNDRIVQAKESEINRNFRDLRNRLPEQILRRLNSQDVISAYNNAESRPQIELPSAGTASPAPSPRPAAGQIAH